MKSITFHSNSVLCKNLTRVTVLFSQTAPHLVTKRKPRGSQKQQQKQSNPAI